MRTVESIVTGIAALAIMTACVGHAPDPSVTPGETSVATTVDSLTLEVDNHNWSDIVVSLIHDGVVSRLTEVTAGASKAFVIPNHLIGQLGQLRIAVRGIGANDRYVSEVLSVRTGATVRLTVESSVNRSSVGVW